MEKTTKITQTVVATIIASVAIVAALAWQSINTIIQKGLADGKSIRVSERNSCTTEEVSSAPHFSGCNSIL
jgi:hypothetical protein